MHDSIEYARLLFYNDILMKLNRTDDIWRELRHLGVCTLKSEASSPFSLDELNEYFSGLRCVRSLGPIS